MKQELKTADKDFCTTLTRPLFKEDKEAYTISIKTENEGERVQVIALRADGQKIVATGTTPDENGVSACTLTRDMYAVQGKLILRVTVVSGNSSITVRQIECTVMEDFNGKTDTGN